MTSSTQHGQMYVMESEEGGTHIYRRCIAALLGCLILPCSGLVFGFEISLILEGDVYIYSGIWCGILFFLTGIVTIAGACIKSNCWVQTTMVFNLVSTLAAVFLIVSSSIVVSIIRYRRIVMVSYIVTIAFSFISMILFIIVICLTGQSIFGWCGAHRQSRLRPGHDVDSTTRNPEDALTQANNLFGCRPSITPGIVHSTAPPT